MSEAASTDDDVTNPGIGAVLRAIETEAKRNELRHLAVLAIATEQTRQGAVQVDHERRLSRVELNSTDGLRWPAWALVAVVTAGELAIIGLEAQRMWSPL